jgi:hypothetical protein
MRENEIREGILKMSWWATLRTWAKHKKQKRKKIRKPEITKKCARGFFTTLTNGRSSGIGGTEDIDLLGRGLIMDVTNAVVSSDWPSCSYFFELSWLSWVMARRRRDWMDGVLDRSEETLCAYQSLESLFKHFPSFFLCDMWLNCIWKIWIGLVIEISTLVVLRRRWVLSEWSPNWSSEASQRHKFQPSNAWFSYLLLMRIWSATFPTHPQLNASSCYPILVDLTWYSFVSRDYIP